MKRLPMTDRADLLAQYHEAYRAAIAADEAFSRELTRVYGKNACNARYYYAHADQGVTAAMLVKVAADTVMHEALETLSRDR